MIVSIEAGLMKVLHLQNLFELGRPEYNYSTDGFLKKTCGCVANYCRLLISAFMNFY